MIFLLKLNDFSVESSTKDMNNVFEQIHSAEILSEKVDKLISVLDQPKNDNELGSELKGRLVASRFGIKFFYTFQSSLIDDTEFKIESCVYMKGDKITLINMASDLLHDAELHKLGIENRLIEDLEAINLNTGNMLDVTSINVLMHKVHESFQPNEHFFEYQDFSLAGSKTKFFKGSIHIKTQMFSLKFHQKDNYKQLSTIFKVKRCVIISDLFLPTIFREQNFDGGWKRKETQILNNGFFECFTLDDVKDIQTFFEGVFSR